MTTAHHLFNNTAQILQWEGAGPAYAVPLPPPVLIFFESHYATRSPMTFDPTSGSKVIFELGKFFGTPNCRGRA